MKIFRTTLFLFVSLCLILCLSLSDSLCFFNPSVSVCLSLSMLVCELYECISMFLHIWIHACIDFRASVCGDQKNFKCHSTVSTPHPLILEARFFHWLVCYPHSSQSLLDPGGSACLCLFASAVLGLYWMTL